MKNAKADLRKFNNACQEALEDPKAKQTLKKFEEQSKPDEPVRRTSGSLRSLGRLLADHKKVTLVKSNETTIDSFGNYDVAIELTPEQTAMKERIEKDMSDLGLNLDWPNLELQRFPKLKLRHAVIKYPELLQQCFIKTIIQSEPCITMYLY